jgi:hypothetical protein
MAKVGQEINVSTVQTINRSKGTFSAMSGITVHDEGGFHNFYLGVYGSLKNGYVNLNDCGTMYCLNRSRGHIMALLDLLGHTSYRVIKSEKEVNEFIDFLVNFRHDF